LGHLQAPWLSGDAVVPVDGVNTPPASPDCAERMGAGWPS